MTKQNEKKLIKGLINSHLTELIKETQMITHEKINTGSVDWEGLEFKILKTISKNTL